MKQILSKHENKWIAIDKDYKKVYVSKTSLEELQKETKRLNIKDAIVMFVPSFNEHLAPQCL